MVKRQDLKSYPFIVIATLHRLVRIFLGVAPRNIEPPPPPSPCALSRRRPAGARSARNAPHARADGASVRMCGDGMEGARRRSVRARSRTARRRVPPPARAPPSPQRRALPRPRPARRALPRPASARPPPPPPRLRARVQSRRRSVRRRSRTARETFRHRYQRRHHRVVLARRSVCKRCIVSKSECESQLKKQKGKRTVRPLRPAPSPRRHAHPRSRDRRRHRVLCCRVERRHHLERRRRHHHLVRRQRCIVSKSECVRVNSKNQKGKRTVRPRPRQPRCKLARPPDGRHHRAVCERAARTSHTGAAPVCVHGRRARRSATGASATATASALCASASSTTALCARASARPPPPPRRLGARGQDGAYRRSARRRSRTARKPFRHRRKRRHYRDVRFRVGDGAAAIASCAAASSVLPL